jgi:hypothetical protein
VARRALLWHPSCQQEGLHTLPRSERAGCWLGWGVSDIGVLRFLSDVCDVGVRARIGDLWPIGLIRSTGAV